jgi:hypothetical protein
VTRAKPPTSDLRPDALPARARLDPGLQATDQAQGRGRALLSVNVGTWIRSGGVRCENGRTLVELGNWYCAEIQEFLATPRLTWIRWIVWACSVFGVFVGFLGRRIWVLLCYANHRYIYIGATSTYVYSLNSNAHAMPTPMPTPMPTYAPTQHQQQYQPRY